MGRRILRILRYIAYVGLFIVVLIAFVVLYAISIETPFGLLPEISRGAFGGTIIGACIGIYRVVSKRSRQAETLATSDEEKELEANIKIVEIETEKRIANIDEEIAGVISGKHHTLPPHKVAVTSNAYKECREGERCRRWAIALGVISLIAVAFFVFPSLALLLKKDAKAYFEKGERLYRTGQWDVASVYYSKAIKINPEYASAYVRRGVIYYNDGQGYANEMNFRKARENHDKAIKDFTKAIEIDPKNASAYFWRGECYAGKGSVIYDENRRYYASYYNYDYSGKRKEIEKKAVEKAIGDYNKAIKDYKMALKIAPNDKHANTGLRDVYWRLGKKGVQQEQPRRQRK